uniref:ATP synthase complex subunit 8 n=3 Tax=Pyralidae TaxID=7135 RepID=A0A6C0W5A3_9NEOP|nr:ATP synthase F0 subunit 8 [Orthaga olivacea]YP_009764329.1 ATP synthase F0 subunit 8 [Orthopygia glaucinalis]YP_010177471.1 ATP synthase F0 subunit 8 [Aglossa dimidiata]QIC20463.1 ATP synthase F0 subunit 8 [Orthaga olivacea]QIS91168.1 ATP synthase F0 subunit 8 [Orthopygia glaucinalis]QST15205.1 ATP synthase F0 subunit 8 [Aglossa dimidiata]
MPQMMPINWLFSLLFFILIFIIFNMMNYYIFNFNIKLKNNTNKFSLSNLTWKW